jgi:ammonia channel protein AmtB
MTFLVSGFAFPVVAHWTHFPDGWLRVHKFTDFAGAGVLHIVRAGTLTEGKGSVQLTSFRGAVL